MPADVVLIILMAPSKIFHLKKNPSIPGTRKSFKQVIVIGDSMFRISRSEVFLRKAGLKISSKFTGEQPCPSVVSIKLQCNL